MITLDLTGKRALVCGSTQGIGKAIAVAFAEAGANVVLAARDEDSLKAVLRELRTEGEQAHDYIVADFSTVQSVSDALQTYHEVNSSPTIHILVNNTGGPASGSILEATQEAFIAAFTQHILINQLLTTQLLVGMKREGYGRIINVISTSVKQPIPNLGVSNTTRGAVASWAKTLSYEVAPFGITVNNILPGYIKTGRLDYVLESTAKAQGRSTDAVAADMIQSIPVGRFGEPLELAHLAVFLASPFSGYITGTSIAVDGGRTTAL